MTIDDKLFNILESTKKDDYMKVQAIKQAFLEDNWIPHPPGKNGEDYVFFTKEYLQQIEKTGYTTGQEFYDRFEKELKTMPHDIYLTSIDSDDAGYTDKLILDVARKAAGLK